jgi:phage baseplate assembly protein gpV
MQRRLPLLTRSMVAGVSALGMLAAFGAGNALASTHASSTHTAASYRAEALALLKHLKIGSPGTNHAVYGHMTVKFNKAPSQVDSTNWSGYADSGSTKYSKVAGAWTEPTATCTSTTALAAFWVGIDGYSTDTVEQDGTLIECVGGTATYYSWWELYPKNDIQVVGTTVKPGDKISASVVKKGTKYTMKLTDSTTTANSFSHTIACAAKTCTDGSAEWIAEAPSGESGVYPLAGYGTWSLSGATVTGGGKAGKISSFTDDEITMVNGSTGAVESKPSSLNSAGNAFTTTWESA